MGLQLERKLKILEGSDRTMIGKIITIEEALPTKHIIFLGDPGAGKTFLFKTLSTKATYYKVRSFISIDPREQANTPLFIDALDEFRSRSKDMDLILELVKSLSRNNVDSTRISCRAIDWFGNADIEPLKDYFGNASWIVVRIEELSISESIDVLEYHNVPEAQGFVAQAVDLGMGDLLKNPQTLLMLNSAVRDSGWPRSRTELYQKALNFLLSESNEKHAQSLGADYSIGELLEILEEVSATYLLSGFDSISLIDSNIESALNINLWSSKDRKIILFATSRRLFNSTDVHEVDFAHRTFAEYLGGKFIARKVEQGLPLKRALSLFGSNWIPTSDVRGLFAWLPVFMPSYSDELIELDPFAVCNYGDVAGLSVVSKRKLLAGLSCLAKSNPHLFLDFDQNTCSALTTEDLEDELIEVIQGDYDLRYKAFVVSILKGANLSPEFENFLTDLFLDISIDANLRLRLANALCDFDTGKKAIEQFYQSGAFEIAEKIEVAIQCLDIVFSIDDIIPVLVEYAFSSSDDIAFNISIELFLLQLDPKSKIKVVESLVDNLSPEEIEFPYHISESKFGDFFAACLADAIYVEDRVEKVFSWLVLYSEIRVSLGSHRDYDEKVANYVKINYSSLISCFLSGLYPKPVDRLEFFRVRKIFLWCIQLEEIILHLVDYVGDKEDWSESVSDNVLVFLAEALLINNSNPELYLEIVDHLSERLSGDNLDRITSCTVSRWQLENARSRREREERERDRILHNEEYIRAYIGSAKSGNHIGVLKFVADIYLGSIDSKSNNPIERLENEIPKEFVDDCLEGLLKFVEKTPTVNAKRAVRAVGSTRFCDRTWAIFVAGIDWHWECYKNFDSLKEGQLISAYILSERFPKVYKEKNSSTFEIREWQRYLSEERRDIVDKALDIVSLQILSDTNPLRKILDYDFTKNRDDPGVTEKLLKFLERSHLENTEDILRILSNVILREGISENLKNIFSDLFSNVAFRSLDNRLMILSINISINGVGLSEISEFLKLHKAHEWMLIDTIETVKNSSKLGFDEIFSLDNLEGLTRLISSKFPYVPTPDGSWVGEHNDFDAARFVISLISALGRVREERASSILSELIKSPSLNSYNFYLRRTLFEKIAVEHDLYFEKPSPGQVLETLKNLSPHNSEDLFALFIHVFSEIKDEISYSNTSVFRSFWNTDSHGKVTDPKVEDLCRDRLQELLERKVEKIGISLEPEALMAQQKRSDLIAKTNGHILPIELKRAWHDELWTARNDQLERMYSVRPEAAGFGVYVVFWFGPKFTRKIKRPPDGSEVPQTAVELEQKLRALGDCQKTAVFVIDVSPPFDN